MSFTTYSGSVAPGAAGSAQSLVTASNTAFQNGFAKGATLAQLQSAVAGFSVPNFNTVASNYNNPKYLEWNFEVQQGLGNNMSLSVNYVGNHGTDETLQNLYLNAYAKNFSGLPTTVPDARFGEIRELYSGGYSNFDGLVTTLKWHVGSQFQGSFSYTYSHALDTCSNDCIEPFNFLTAASLRYQNSPNIGLSYGSSDYDVRHSINAHYVYTVAPSMFNNRAVKAVAGNWTLAGTVLYHSGYPFSVVDTGVRGAQGVGNLAGIATDVVLADWISPTTTYPSCTTPNSTCYSKSLFATAASQTNFGNIPRNAFRGPGYFDTDINVNRTFSIHERYKFLIGMYFFNLFNHPNFDLPVNNLNSGEFGSIISTVSAPSSPYGSFQGSAVSGRVGELQLKFSF